MHVQLYVWMNRQAVRAITAHQPGRQLIASDGVVTYGGVRALRLRADGATLLSGGVRSHLGSLMLALTQLDTLRLWRDRRSCVSNRCALMLLPLFLPTQSTLR